jgi:hypothetical protein
VKKLFLTFFLLACAPKNTNTLRTFSAQNDPAPTSIDLSAYSTPPLPDLSNQVNIRSIPVDSATSARQAIIRQGARYESPFDGVCFNNEAEAVIEASFSEQIRSQRNENRRALAETNARALRDLSTMQADANLLRSLYQSRLNDRDQELNSANRIINSLERASSTNVWYNIAWASLGGLIGIATSGIYLLVTH